MIRVLLADDNAFVRSALAELFTASTDMEVVAICADGDEVLEVAAATRPEVVLLDLAMPHMDGLEAARRLLAVQPDARVVILTANSSAAALRRARAIGAVGYLLKDLDPEEIRGAVRTVARGETAWPTGSGPEGNQVTDTALADTIRSDTTRIARKDRGL